MSERRIRLGTRGSQLAMRQSEVVAEQLRNNGCEVDIVIIRTRGDETTLPISTIGGKGAFTSRIQEALLDDSIDLAVHSLKDLPAIAREGLTLAAVPKRENPRDALVLPLAAANCCNSVADLPAGARIGTGSIRRKSQLLRLRADLDVQDIRGNVDTRLRKVDNGEYDAVVLACAGLIRLGNRQRISCEFSEDEFVPAVGQGALALEVREQDSTTFSTVRCLNDAFSFSCVTAERAMLERLNAGCLAAVGAISHCLNDELTLQGVVMSHDGKQRVSATCTGSSDDSIIVGKQTAESLLKQGALRFLDRD